MTTNLATQASTAAHDFDFWMGSWKLANERLKRRLDNCDEWESFGATVHARPLPGGIGNIDEWIPDEGWRPGFAGVGIRVYQPATQKWSIYWVDNMIAEMQPPVVGGFKDGVGIFEGPDVFQGRPILVRFTWSHITADSARWEQAFSEDDGKSWETNWRMRMTRIGG